MVDMVVCGNDHGRQFNVMPRTWFSKTVGIPDVMGRADV